MNQNCRPQTARRTKPGRCCPTHVTLDTQAQTRLMILGWPEKNHVPGTVDQPLRRLSDRARLPKAVNAQMPIRSSTPDLDKYAESTFKFQLYDFRSHRVEDRLDEIVEVVVRCHLDIPTRRQLPKRPSYRSGDRNTSLPWL